VFWPDSLSLRDDLFDLSLVQGHRQITDIYLLGLAVAMDGALATFDNTIPVKAVRGTTAGRLLVIGAVEG
jgi:uncharacterized protein